MPSDVAGSYWMSEQHEKNVRSMNMPDVHCKACGNIFKPFPLELKQTDWPPMDEVPCPKCANKVLVFVDKELEKKYYDSKLPSQERLERRLDGFEKELHGLREEVGAMQQEAAKAGYEEASKNLEERLINFIVEETKRQVEALAKKRSPPKPPPKVVYGQ